MSLPEGAVPKSRPILGIRDLVREDMAVLKDGPRDRTTSTVERFKDPHHRIARLFATGLRTNEVCAKSGYTYQRLTSLYGDPAFQELIAHYRKLVDETWAETQEDFYSLATSNMVRAEKHVAQRLDEAEEAGEAIPIKDALAISRDAADRFGFGKKSQVTNVNIDFAAQLERAIKRSGKQINGEIAGADSAKLSGLHPDSEMRILEAPRSLQPTESPRVAGPPQPSLAPQAPSRLGSHPTDPIRRRA